MHCVVYIHTCHTYTNVNIRTFAHTLTDAFTPDTCAISMRQVEDGCHVLYPGQKKLYLHYMIP